MAIFKGLGISMKDRLFKRPGNQEKATLSGVEFANGVKLLAERNGNNLSVRFKKEGVEIFDFKKDLLPENTEFELSNEWRFVNGRVLIEKVNAPLDLLNLLHEIGHSHPNTDHLTSFENARKQYYEEIKKDRDNAYPDSRIAALKTEMDTLRAIEIDAWGYAKSTLADLDQKLNLEAIQRISADKIDQHITTCLDSHIMKYFYWRI